MLHILTKKNASWKGSFSIQLLRPDNTGMMGLSQIVFSKTGKTHMLYATSDEGDFFTVDCSLKTLDDAGKPQIILNLNSAERNTRPTVAVDSSPFYDDLLLTVHDCHFCIWKLQCPDPVFISPYLTLVGEKTYITCGFWSPSRQGVIYIGRSDGTIDIWDFMDHVDGCLHLLKLPLNLRRKMIGEQEAVASFFSKEMERVLYFKERFNYREDTRLREEELLKTREEDDDRVVRREDVGFDLILA
jgi:dynein intermediate chain 3, axonemal